MSELPEWTSTVEGFDPARWWRPIVCTHGTGEVAESVMLGIIFEHAGVSEPHAIAWYLEWVDHIHRVERDDVDVNNLSLNFRCPLCDRTPRIPRERWVEVVRNTRRDEPGWVDVSLYG